MYRPYYPSLSLLFSLAIIDSQGSLSASHGLHIHHTTHARTQSSSGFINLDGSKFGMGGVSAGMGLHRGGVE